MLFAFKWRGTSAMTGAGVSLRPHEPPGGSRAMGWVTEALKELSEGRQAQVRPHGGSMRDRIESGQLVTLAPVNPADVREGDGVLVRWRGNYLLHLVKKIQDDRFMHRNNHGKTNGWVLAADIRAKVVRVEE